MKVIRQGVWETNSSSTHSLIVGREVLEQDLFLDTTTREENYNRFKQKLEGQTLHIYLGEYRWGYDRLTSFVEKMEYLATSIVCAQDVHTEEDALRLLDHRGFLDVFRDHFGVRDFRIYNYDSAYIDHQSYGNIENVFSSRFFDEVGQEVVNFLADTRIHIEIYNDNSMESDHFRDKAVISNMGNLYDSNRMETAVNTDWWEEEDE